MAGEAPAQQQQQQQPSQEIFDKLNGKEKEKSNNSSLSDSRTLNMFLKLLYHLSCIGIYKFFIVKPLKFLWSSGEKAIKSKYELNVEKATTASPTVEAGAATLPAQNTIAAGAASPTVEAGATVHVTPQEPTTPNPVDLSFQAAAAEANAPQLMSTRPPQVGAII